MKKLLIIEDEPIVLKAVARALPRYLGQDIEILVASTFVDAIPLIALVDIVLTDYELDRGCTAKDVIGYLPELTPCVLYTALEPDEIPERVRARMASVHTKPISPKELAAAIAIALR